MFVLVPCGAQPHAPSHPPLPPISRTLGPRRVDGWWLGFTNTKHVRKEYLCLLEWDGGREPTHDPSCARRSASFVWREKSCILQAIIFASLRIPIKK